MNDCKISPDDPRLTAYALGELEPDQQAEIEALLRADPAAQAVVDEIRTTATAIEAALEGEETAAEAVDTTASTAPVGILPSRDPTKLDGGAYWGAPAPRKVIRFPQFYYIVGGLAAACFAVMVVWHEQHRPPLPVVKHYTAVALTPATVSEESEAKPAATNAVELVKNERTDREAGAAAETVPAPDMSLLRQAKDASGSTRVAESKVVFDAKKGGRPLADATPGMIVMPPSQSKSAGAAPDALPSFNGSMPAATATIGSGLGGVLQPSAPNVRGSVVIDNTTVPLDRLAAANAPANGVDLFPGPARAAKADTWSYGGTVRNDSDVVMMSPFRVASAGGGGTPIVVSSDSIAGAKSIAEIQRTIRSGYIVPGPAPSSRVRPGNTESYAYQRDNDFVGAAQNPFSTFGVDVDTASYANVRRFITGGRLPPADAVRIEELLNYFPYRYAAAATKGVAERDGGGTDAPFAASLEVADAPWAPTHRLVRVGLQAREMATAARPPANLVFLLDVSGSMATANKLPLVKESMRLLVSRLRPDDRVAIVTYAGESGLALPSTPVAQSREIIAALDGLAAGGSTNGGMGIQLAYDIAKANAAKDSINRVILCTDGDFNVGMTSEGALVRLVEEKAKSGVFLTVLGFGMGNYKDSTLEKLADTGNGNYGYIDTRREAEKLLVEQVNGTLVPVAKDVKVQVEFNPTQIASYRLIGYEDRALKTEDFNNDKVDAGEIGAGHTVTALYEVVPVGAEQDSPAQVASVDERRYRRPDTGSRKIEPASASTDPKFRELLTVKIRYKEPTADVSKKLEFPLVDSGEKFTAASADFKFTAAVAEFGMILRNSPHKGSATIGDVVAWAAAGCASPSDDPGGYRNEFLDLARQAQLMLR